LESAELSRLELTIARKITNTTVANAAESVIDEIVAQCLPLVFSKPRLMIELHPETLEQTITRIETQLISHGFEGELQVKPNPDMHVSDIKLDWGHGQMIRNTADIWQSLEQAIAATPLSATFPEASVLSSVTDSLSEATGDEYGG
jgi:flagellar biosynthesis/type III secretory pathway protein FliH